MRILKSSVIALGLLALGATATEGFAAKGAKSPYDTIYVVTADTTLRSAPEAGSSVKVQLAKGTEGVVMRWCRPEFDFRAWAYGSTRDRRNMLKSHICEVKANGVVGFIDAKFLDPM
ncbi:hypothetical protein [uncultured Cohaesibacter sp.]|uniref:hypothetical protein n=1 Tax=uncultured Cohaesibacter sp. TaxID=1002546 RepID=UPI0029C85ACC|nr:hypothetical protein [uncultured Cohaesibacter sp.]